MVMHTNQTMVICKGEEYVTFNLIDWCWEARGGGFLIENNIK